MEWVLPVGSPASHRLPAAQSSRRRAGAEGQLKLIEREVWNAPCTLLSLLLGSRLTAVCVVHQEARITAIELEIYLSGEAQQYHECIEACVACLVACEMCADACLAEGDGKMMVACIGLDTDCADSCVGACRRCAAACRKMAA